jgi:hypothetical protein
MPEIAPIRLRARAPWQHALAALALVLIATVAPAVEAPAPAEPVIADPTTDAVLLGSDALAELVGPIALYPDDLLGIVLPASTFPLQVVQAARFIEAAKVDPKLEPDPDWDPSVVALLNYPEVIALLNDDIDWTWRLGEAVINQQSDVLAAVQAFRSRANVAGNLRTDANQVVENTGETIIIKPASPERIYVPYYEPARVVVYQPYPVYHYYPTPYPVYYYPYPDDYGYPWPYFWGLTSAYWIGWDSHYVHHYHHHHHHHPYWGRHYGRRYYYHDHDYDRWHKPFPRHGGWDGDGYAHRDRYDDRDGYRDRYDDRRGGYRGDDHDDRWVPDRRRGGARPWPGGDGRYDRATRGEWQQGFAERNESPATRAEGDRSRGDRGSRADHGRREDAPGTRSDGNRPRSGEAPPTWSADAAPSFERRARSGRIASGSSLPQSQARREAPGARGSSLSQRRANSRDRVAHRGSVAGSRSAHGSSIPPGARVIASGSSMPRSAPTPRFERRERVEGAGGSARSPAREVRRSAVPPDRGPSIASRNTPPRAQPRASVQSFAADRPAPAARADGRPMRGSDAGPSPRRSDGGHADNRRADSGRGDGGGRREGGGRGDGGWGRSHHR